MALPALDHLAAHGFALTLAGRPWARDLFAAYPWPAVSLTGSGMDRIRALRHVGLNTGLLLTNSFGTALEFRLAGISAMGYARDGRSWLLREAIKIDASDHMVEYYYRLAASLTGVLTDRALLERDSSTVMWLPLAFVGLFIVRGLASFCS